MANSKTKRVTGLKKLAFPMWLAGKSMDAIEEELRRRFPSMSGADVPGWVFDWERGKQRRWDAVRK